MPSVAPLAGAWIETKMRHDFIEPACVAPLAGAWIETVSQKLKFTSATRSRPSRARGLKLFIRRADAGTCRRAPRGRVD